MRTLLLLLLVTGVACTESSPFRASAPDVAVPAADPGLAGPEADSVASVDLQPEVGQRALGRCSAPLAREIGPVAPLPAPFQAARGVDAAERGAYEQLRDEVLADPRVHFVTTWLAEEEAFVVESGAEEQRTRLVFRRMWSADAGLEHAVLEGSVASIFPRTDPRTFPTYEGLLAAFITPEGMAWPDLGYEEADPRIGRLAASEQVYPYPLLRIAALFDAPHAPDVMIALYPWAHNAPGTHGGLSLLQSRSSLIVSGKGARDGVVLDTAAILPDVVPTVLAALGAPTTGGTGPDGVYDDGLYLQRQDGRVLWDALHEDPCERAQHVLLVDFDGLLATELNHLVLAEDPARELPTFRELAADGVVFQYGAVSNFPSVSAPGHMTLGTGLWSGHHGFIANAFYRREQEDSLSPFTLLTELSTFLADPEAAIALYESGVAPGAETLAQAVHRSLGPEHFVAVFNELAVGGADYNTLDYLTGMVPQAQTAGLAEYKIADGLAVTQVVSLLQNPTVPVPTVIQVSLVATDAAGEGAGPHSELLRDTLAEVDDQLRKMLEAYEARGVGAELLVVLSSDHGMELQDSSDSVGLRTLIENSGVRLRQPATGMIYLRTMRLTWEDTAEGIQVRVTNGDTGAPVSGAIVACTTGCDASITSQSGPSGLALLPLRGLEGVALSVNHSDFNPRTLLLTPPTP